ncbi:chromate transporter [Planctomycetales bacterium]|nr:chromate transporter [Planctomycetales bacterium]
MTPPPPPPIGLWQLLWVFIKVSTFTVGGGYVMIPVFREELVAKRRWLTDEEMLAVIAVAQACPGIFACNTAVGVGERLRGGWGALVAVVGVVLTPFIAIVIIAAAFAQIGDNALVNHALSGARAGVTALILVTLLKMRRQTLTHWLAIFLAASAFVAMWFGQVNPLGIIAAGAAVGLLAMRQRTINN